MTRNIASILFSGGLFFMLLAIASQLGFGNPPMLVGDGIIERAADEVGAANFVTSVLLAYRGLDTLGELSILFAASTAGSLVLGHRRKGARHDPEGGLILATGADLLFPLLLVVGIYIVVHGHLTPGGGFQGGVILATAFFMAVLARPSRGLDHRVISIIEGLAGATFIALGLLALAMHGAFLKPLMVDPAALGSLVSAGTLPILSIAVGLKVGSELAGLMAHISNTEAPDQ